MLYYTLVMNSIFLGIDTGGTFTDFMLYDGSSIRIHKCLSTPQEPEKAILAGIKELGISPEYLTIIHGSTVATNTVLENKGVRTVFISNHGMRDILSIGRQQRKALYDLQPKKIPPPVARELCLETGGRLDAQGAIIEPLSTEQLQHLNMRIEQLAPQAVAINLLFSFLDDRFEKAIASIVPQGIFISRSSQILPEYKEYERASTTWLNASVGPIVERYLSKLSTALPQSNLTIMQSSGGIIAAKQAAQYAVHMLLSGPAGGIAAAQFIAQQSQRHKLLSFDMGGTSTDVSLIDGEIQLTSENQINGYPVGIPMIDIHTIGAGGGSLAYVDEGGLLHVGPQSAGAEPGPACYQQGGSIATVTDANVVLGRIPAETRLGGRMPINVEAARKAINRCAQQLKLSIEDTALGIIQVANEHMARALRVISVQRGLNPNHFTLVSFGGAGGLHVCALADALAMQQALIPLHSGVLSALGMLVAPRTRHLSRTAPGLIDQYQKAEIENIFQDMETEGQYALKNEGIPNQDITLTRTVDLRYLGQSYTLSVPWKALASTRSDFHQAHQTCYGHQLARPVEVVTFRVSAKGPAPDIATTSPTITSPFNKTTVAVHGINEAVPVWLRNAIPVNTSLSGPLLVSESTSTSYIAPGWRVEKDQTGNLLLDKNV